MTRQEIEDLLPYFSSPYEGTYKVELCLLSNNETYRRANIASIIKYDYDKFLEDINNEFQNNKDLKEGILTVKQLEHSLKIKHSIIAESIEYVMDGHENDHHNHLFYRFIRNVSNVATRHLLSLKASNTE